MNGSDDARWSVSIHGEVMTSEGDMWSAGER